MVLREVVIPCDNHVHVHNHPNKNTFNEKQPSSQQLLPVSDPVTSYWLKDPHRYANLRSTPSLPSLCDIAIIGSGMAGIMTAYHILQSSHTLFRTTGQPIPNIVILEARELCSGATARNGGHAKVKTATLTGMEDGKMRSAIQEYVHNVIQDIKRVVDEEGLDCEFELRRSFDVFQDPEEYGKVKDVYEQAKKEGEKWVEGISLVPEEHVQQVTNVQEAVGAFSVETASFWPYKFCTRVLERMLERWEGRVNVQTHTAVTSLTINKEGRSMLETERGTIRAEKVVLATNAYTAGLVPSFKDTIVPYKGMNSHHVPAVPVHPHLNQTYNIHFAPSPSGSPTGVDYLNPRPDGSIVVGGGKWFYEHDKSSWHNNFDDSESGRFAPSVEAHWDDYMQNTFLGWYVPFPAPSLPKLTHSRKNSGSHTSCIWIGIEASTPDSLPHIGRIPNTSKQWMLAGFNGGGMALIATAAKAVAKMVVQDLGFDDVKEEFGLLGEFGTDMKRMKHGDEKKEQDDVRRGPSTVDGGARHDCRCFGW
jgi:glycine/D-amino acid oxidase-like deaminating enzyme